MQSEKDTLVEERFLCVDGFVSPEALKQVSAGLPLVKPERSATFFVQFSYADLPVGKEFQIAFLKHAPQLFVKCVSKIIAVSQQFAKALPEVPHGWKTICCIEFPEGMAELLERLPVANSWYQNRQPVCLSSIETWQAILAKPTR